MVQAPALDGQFLDLLPFCQDGRPTPEVDVSGREVAKALVIAVVVVMNDKGGDGCLKPGGQAKPRRSVLVRIEFVSSGHAHPNGSSLRHTYSFVHLLAASAVCCSKFLPPAAAKLADLVVQPYLRNYL